MRVDVTATAIPANQPAGFPCLHGLGAVPDFALIISGNEQCVWLSADPTVNLVANTDPANPHIVSVVSVVYDHSIEAAGAAPTGLPTKIDTLSPVLTGGGAPDVVPHNLGAVPDLILPLGTYLAPVAGMGVLSILGATDTDLTVACSGNAGPLGIIAVKHHSILSEQKGVFDDSVFFSVALDVVVPWAGGPPGTRLVAHGAPWVPDYCLVTHWSSAGLTFPESVWLQDGGVLDGTNVEIYTAAGADATVTLWLIRRHSIVSTG